MADLDNEPIPNLENDPQKKALENPQNDKRHDIYASPYYIHYSDCPGAILVSKPLTGDNYYSWSHSMKIALNAKNKMAFIDGSLPRPLETSSLFAAWDRANDMDMSSILNALAADIADSILHSSSAHEIWVDLQERFSQSCTPRIFELTCSIATLQQENSSVSAYYSKLKSFWDELSSIALIPPCSCGASRSPS